MNAPKPPRPRARRGATPATPIEARTGVPSAQPREAEATRAKPRATAAVEPMVRTLRSRLKSGRALTAAQDRALHELAAWASREGAEGIDATLTPRGLFVSMVPARRAEGAHGASDPAATVPAALEARLRRAFAAGAVRASFAERPPLPTPSPDGTAQREAAALARDWLARARSLEDECVRDEDPEGVHEIRIALRRCRAALRWLARCTRDARVQEVTGVLRTLSAVAGPVRDADVVSAMLRKRAPAQPGRDAAIAAVHAERVERVQAMVAHLRSRVYRAAARRADEALAALEQGLSGDAVAGADRGSERAARSAQRYFDRELRRIHERLEGDLTVDEGYHAVRRQLRRVRDIIDVCGPLLGARRGAWRAKLQPVQSLLGSFNDAVIALEVLKKSPTAPKEIKSWLKARRASALTEMATPLAVVAVLVIAR